MKRRAISFVQGVRTMHTPQGIVQSQEEIVRVFSLETTLEQIYEHVHDKNATKVVIVFENEEWRDS